MLKSIIIASAAALTIAGSTISSADAGYRRHHFYGYGHVHKPYYGYSHGYSAPTCVWKKVWFHGGYHWKRFCW
ncbi:MAG TPA: hypothetical protein PK264_08400 [Hyphomicrobiaceae bacterium]|nr:hypothetical protein [Hyphomicrobiaceae bacterium]